MADDSARPNRRIFLKTIGLTGLALPAGASQAPVAPSAPAATPPAAAGATPDEATSARRVTWPRVFTGRQLTRIAFPLGGVAAGTIGLGGRGQLTDWEIYNRPDKGNVPEYAFASLLVQREGKPPVSRVLESRLQPPYDGSSGLGSGNVPGLPRFESAEFTGEYPFARIAFKDRKVPVRASLEAFSPFIPHEPDDSGLPIAVLRYRLTNPTAAPITASIAWSVQNPFVSLEPATARSPTRGAPSPATTARVQGLLLSNPGLAPAAPLQGTFVVGVLDAGDGHVTRRRWERAGWWTSVLHFWDDFTKDGALDPESSSSGPVAAVCLAADDRAGRVGRLHLPARVARPEPHAGALRVDGPAGRRAGRHRQPLLHAVRGRVGGGDARGGTARRPRSEDADVRRRGAREHAARRGEGRRDVEPLDARHADLLPHRRRRVPRVRGQQRQERLLHRQLHARVELRDLDRRTSSPRSRARCARSAFGYSLDDDGAMHFRQMLPDGKARSGFAAADGQMGQIVKVYLDWRLSGDDDAARRVCSRRRGRRSPSRGSRAAGTPTATA